MAEVRLRPGQSGIEDAFPRMARHSASSEHRAGVHKLEVAEVRRRHSAVQQRRRVEAAIHRHAPGEAALGEVRAPGQGAQQVGGAGEGAPDGGADLYRQAGQGARR